MCSTSAGKPAIAYKNRYLIVTNKKSRTLSATRLPLDLTKAVERFLQEGGIINVVPFGETAEFSKDAALATKTSIEICDEKTKKNELLKCLVAKGAGVNSIQYSLRMNRKEIRRMAGEQGLKIPHSRPVRTARNETSIQPESVSDETAGLAMHYSSLGYNVIEIAQKVHLSVRQVWRIGLEYHFEFGKTKDRGTAD